MLFWKFWQKFSQNTALATPSPSFFNCVCHDMTPPPAESLLPSPPTAKCSYTYEFKWWHICRNLQVYNNISSRVLNLMKNWRLRWSQRENLFYTWFFRDIFIQLSGPGGVFMYYSASTLACSLNKCQLNHNCRLEPNKLPLGKDWPKIGNSATCWSIDVLVEIWEDQWKIVVESNFKYVQDCRMLHWIFKIFEFKIFIRCFGNSTPKRDLIIMSIRKALVIRFSSVFFPMSVFKLVNLFTRN